MFNRFLYYFFVSQYDQLRGLSQEGTQKNLSATLVKDVRLPIPPAKEQKVIASILSSVDDKITAQENELEGLQQMKKGLMQDLLTGKVRVKV